MSVLNKIVILVFVVVGFLIGVLFMVNVNLKYVVIVVNVVDGMVLYFCNVDVCCYFVLLIKVMIFYMFFEVLEEGCIILNMKMFVFWCVVG